MDGLDKTNCSFALDGTCKLNENACNQCKVDLKTSEFHKTIIFGLPWSEIIRKQQENEKRGRDMIVRIVPHYVPLCDNSTWWKVQVRVTWLRIGRFRLWRWKTIGDYSFFDNAKIIAKTIVEVDMINKGSTK